MDGKIARYLNVCTEFGAQLDSLCDMVNFGIAPIFIIFIWRLNELDFIGWGAVLFGSCSIAVRLARFNCTIKDKDDEYDKKYSELFFVGVPSTIASLLYLLPLIIELEMKLRFNTYHIFFYELLISALCISKLPTFSNKSFRFRNYGKPVILIASLLFAVSFIHYFLKTLIFIGVIYFMTIPFSIKKYYDFKCNYNRALESRNK